MTNTGAPPATRKEEAPWIWRFFANVKLGVFWLILLALLSILGTIIPQTTGAVDSLQGYLARIGPERAELFDKLGLLNVYHAWWFNLVLALMCTSIVVASIDRWPRIYKEFSFDEPVPPASRFRGGPFTRNWDLPGAKAKLAELQGLFSSFFGGPQVSHVGEDEVVLYSNRGRWTRMGVFFVHAGILITAGGAVLGNFLGFTAGQMFLREGQARDTVTRIAEITPRGELNTFMDPMPFAVRCDDFEVQFYDDPRTGEKTKRPKLFRSTLTILEGGREKLTEHIEVNTPLRYGGYTFYQASYDEGDPVFHMEALDTQTGEVIPIVARKDEPIKLIGAETSYAVKFFEEDVNVEEKVTLPLGPTVNLQRVDPHGEKLGSIMLLQHYPGFDNERGARYAFRLDGIDVTRETVENPVIHMTAFDNETMTSKELTVALGDSIELDGDPVHYVPVGYDMITLIEQDGDLGPAVSIASLDSEGQEIDRFGVLQRFPEKDLGRGARHVLRLKKIERVFFTGLQVAKDPGVWIVWLGSALMIGGMMLAFSLSHKNAWMRITPQGVSFTAIVHKKRLAFEQTADRFFEELEEKFPAATKKTTTNPTPAPQE